VWSIANLVLSGSPPAEVICSLITASWRSGIVNEAFILTANQCFVSSILCGAVGDFVVKRFVKFALSRCKLVAGFCFLLLVAPVPTLKFFCGSLSSLVLKVQHLMSVTVAFASGPGSCITNWACFLLGCFLIGWCAYFLIEWCAAAAVANPSPRSGVGCVEESCSCSNAEASAPVDDDVNDASVVENVNIQSKPEIVVEEVEDHEDEEIRRHSSEECNKRPSEGQSWIEPADDIDEPVFVTFRMNHDVASSTTGRNTEEATHPDPSLETDGEPEPALVREESNASVSPSRVKQLKRSHFSFLVGHSALKAFFIFILAIVFSLPSVMASPGAGGEGGGSPSSLKRMAVAAGVGFASAAAGAAAGFSSNKRRKSRRLSEDIRELFGQVLASKQTVVAACAAADSSESSNDIVNLFLEAVNHLLSRWKDTSDGSLDATAAFYKEWRPRMIKAMKETGQSIKGLRINLGNLPSPGSTILGVMNWATTDCKVEKDCAANITSAVNACVNCLRYMIPNSLALEAYGKGTEPRKFDSSTFPIFDAIPFDCNKDESVDTQVKSFAEAKDISVGLVYAISIVNLIFHVRLM
jgi:hypothetical protein